MSGIKARLVVLAALVGCATYSPSSPPSTIEPADTRQFVYRGGALGSECSSAREFEAAAGAPEMHNTFGPFDEYGFVLPATRVALLRCRDAVLCSQSVTHLFADFNDASQLCEKLRRRFVAELGPPTLDTHSWGTNPPREVEEFWDEGITRPVSWQLTLSELILDCPREPDGNGFWSVSVTHSTDPQFVSQRSESGDITIVPARACLAPP